MADGELPWPERHAGVLLHPTSLPGPFGIGDLGPEAHNFIDFLATSGQSLWQIMPLGPPGMGNSPYSARSAFAGNALLISPERLLEEGLIDARQLAGAPGGADGRVPFDDVASWKEGLLRCAFARFEARAQHDEIDAFVAGSAEWLADYTLYSALRGVDGRGWWDWPPPLAGRNADALAQATAGLAGEIRYHQFVQWLFFRQWDAIHQHARAQGVRIIGDIPIFVALDSADAWACRHLFKLDAEGRPEAVAGVPPDAFSDTGQLWGNPLYRWDVLRAEGYGWWVQRFHRAFEAMDLARIDHFRGFVAAWEVPAGAPTAERGAWVPGPGRELFGAVAARLGELLIIVEDLGVITEDVRALRDELGYPGMKVLQFAFGDDARNPYLPHNIPPHSVVYTGTHDNDTTRGWAASLTPGQRARVRAFAGDGADTTAALMRMAYGSAAEMAIVPMQDVLRLGSEARMNVPGQPDGNWGWRFRWEQLRPEQVAFLRDSAVLYGRAPRAAKD
ncbi:MAG: 4-alpha-glucanotransferase [Tepidiformaceae bacterium]